MKFTRRHLKVARILAAAYKHSREDSNIINDANEDDVCPWMDNRGRITATVHPSAVLNCVATGILEAHTWGWKSVIPQNFALILDELGKNLQLIAAEYEDGMFRMSVNATMKMLICQLEEDERFTKLSETLDKRSVYRNMSLRLIQEYYATRSNLITFIKSENYC